MCIICGQKRKRREYLDLAEEAKSHFETGRCSEGDGFSARHLRVDLESIGRN